MHELAPGPHAVHRLVEERTVAARLEHRKERFERAPAVADQPDFHRITKADAHGVELDLHGARLAGLRVVLDVGEGGADHQERVARFHGFLRRA